MTRKFRKFYVNDYEALAVLIHGYGFIARKMNFYQIRIKHQESRAMWDWYHTQGTVVITREDRPFRWKKQFGDAEDLAIAINNYVYGKEKITTT